MSARRKRLTSAAQASHDVSEYLRQQPFVHDALVEICDLVGEAMAKTTHDAGDPLLDEINLAIWQLRWKLRLHGGLTSKAKREAAHD